MDQFHQDHFAAESDDPAMQRHEMRDSLFLVANFRVTGEQEFEQVRVRNLSPGGLMAEVTRHLAQDTAVEVDVRGLGPISGKIAWAAVGRVGVAFDEQIDPKLARKPVGAGTKTPSFVKPILTRR